MDEWLEINFPEERDVLVDGTICGTTNKPMLVQRGTHIISLGDPQNYVPDSLQVAIFNTTKQKPMMLVFGLS